VLLAVFLQAAISFPAPAAPIPSAEPDAAADGSAPGVSAEYFAGAEPAGTAAVDRVARNVKRWRAGEHSLRWTATGLLEAEKKFRKVKGFRELEILQRKLNPSLTQQEQVAYRARSPEPPLSTKPGTIPS
jgi:hypothetical protein